MSLYPGKLIVNSNSLRVCTISLDDPYNDWIFYTPKTIVLLYKYNQTELINLLFRDEAEGIMVLENLRNFKRPELQNFWRSIIVLDNQVKIVILTSSSVDQIKREYCSTPDTSLF